MKKKFNITGICIPSLHYMVDTSDRIDDIIDKYIKQNEYFTINRARQYGKSTTLEILYSKLKDEYIVMDISFEAADDCFASAFTLAQGLANKFKRALSMYRIPDELKIIWNKPISKDLPLDDLSERITDFCTMSEKEIILMVDEVDKAADNHIFLSFLGLLREKYLRRAVGRDKTFKSVILAGVHDIKNLKMKMHPEQSHNYNSPWNIAAEFNVDLSFSVKDIAKMLYVYESEHETGMDIEQIAGLLYEYTSGYPYLVSYLCKKIDEDLSCSPQFASLQSAWSKEGVLEAVRLLVKGPNTLYDDMIKHVSEYEDLYNMLHNILLQKNRTAIKTEQMLQLLRYLDAYGQKKGYLLSYNFNKNKEAGVREEMIGDKQIFEVVV